MYATRLLLTDFRSYPHLDVELGPGVTALVGPNGHGKTNIVEALDYLAQLQSHRVASDQPLIRAGADRAVIQAAVVRGERSATIDVEIFSGRANKARVNKQPLSRTRDVVGWVKTVLFAPDDLAIVKGDPAERRRFLDQLAVLYRPHLAGVKADYDRVLRQRNTLLKSARGRRYGSGGSAGSGSAGSGSAGSGSAGSGSAGSGSAGSGSAGFNSAGVNSAGSWLDTLDVWDQQLIELGSQLMCERIKLIANLAPHLATHYAAIAQLSPRNLARAAYRPSFELPNPDLIVSPEKSQIAEEYRAALEQRRGDELDRGLTLVGPHRDELELFVRTDEVELPVRGYASHGESWSFALALRLASFELIRAETGDDPILILDDVFAELDVARRTHLAGLVREAEQVLITAAVLADVPTELIGKTVTVNHGQLGQVDQGGE